MKNFLLKDTPLPSFKWTNVADFESAIESQLENNRVRIKQLLLQSRFTWGNLIVPLDEINNKLENTWSLLEHLVFVNSTQALRKIYNRLLPKISVYMTELGQNRKLFKAFESIVGSLQHEKLNLAQKKVIKNKLRDFKLSGVALTTKKKLHFAELQKRHSLLSAKFEENILDSTHDWSYHIKDKTALEGIPAHVLAAAKAKKLPGWVITLDFPIYNAVMTYCADRNTRKKLYRAYVTRASSQKPHKNKYDNNGIMKELLEIRQQLAELLSFKSYAHYSLATKMAKTPKEVVDFLQALTVRARPGADKEFKELCDFAVKNYRIKKLQPWDISYYSEKLRQAKYKLSQEDLRSYFPEDQVLTGMFTLAEKLYGIRIRERKNFTAWHKDVRFFEVRERNNKIRGFFYTDLYIRANKRSGAWLKECRVRYKDSCGKIRIPAAYLICNFSNPAKTKPSLLTHEEVLTLFHEFGHCLQHVLTKVDYMEVSGINGVEWDAVELPSQFMENFCWKREVIALISCHYKTKEPLPERFFNSLIASKNFQAGLGILRQLEFSLFDFYLHQERFLRQTAQEILDNIRKQTCLFSVPSFNKFQNSFSHIFAGAYAAGYYSYKWAEVLASDAFEQFEEKGCFNKKAARAFLKNILEKGGSQEAMALFIAFKGRKPKIDAFLKSYGIESR